MRVFRNILAYAVSVSILASAFSLTAEAATGDWTNAASGYGFRYRVSTDYVFDETNPQVKLSVEFSDSTPVNLIQVVVESGSHCAYDSFAYHAPSSNFTQNHNTLLGGDDSFLFYNSSNLSAGGITLDIYYDIDDWYNVDHTFKVGVAQFWNSGHNYGYEYTPRTAAADASVVYGMEELRYILGDCNNDQTVDIDDFVIVSNMTSNGSYSVGYVNDQLQYSSTWRANYPGLICAEAANAKNDDTVINSADATAILDYYVVSGSGSIPTSSIGNECIKVLTV